MNNDTSWGLPDHLGIHIPIEQGRQFIHKRMILQQLPRRRPPHWILVKALLQEVFAVVADVVGQLRQRQDLFLEGRDVDHSGVVVREHVRERRPAVEHFVQTAAD